MPDLYSISAYVFALLIILLIVWLFIKPLKLLFKLTFNSILGGCLLYAINWAGGIMGLSVGVNLVTSVCVGILGIPGIVMLYVLKMVL